MQWGTTRKGTVRYLGNSRRGTARCSIGDRTLAKYKRQFNRNASTLQQCERKTGFNVGQLLVLDHLYLDDLALYGTDFSCVSMTQSKLRRTGFAYATLRGTNFSGANLDDFTIPGMVEFMHGEMVKRQPPVTETTWLNDAEPDWRRYRCWSADFRYADLEGALFDNAGVAGADFRGANLEGVSFHGANVSRANFKGARNLVKKAFDGACAGKGDSLGAQPLHDIPDFKVLGC